MKTIGKLPIVFYNFKSPYQKSATDLTMGPEILLVPQAHIRSIAAVWFNLGANNVSISDVLGLGSIESSDLISNQHDQI